MYIMVPRNMFSTTFAGIILVATLGWIAVDGASKIRHEKDADDIEDYCQFQAFNASCPRGSLILLQKARYGRMRKGRCVRGDYGFIGCTADVLRYLDQQCSGKSDCLIDVPDLELIAQPCPEDFKSYLEARYQCIEVAGGTKQDCTQNQVIPLAAESGYLATSVTDTTGYGAASCPWSIKVKEGQKVELVLYNFRPTTEGYNEPQANPREGCPIYVVIREGDSTKEIDLCNYSQREAHLLTSVTNQLEVYFTSPITGTTVPKLIIHYRGTGCADITPPKNTWVTRDGDNAAIRCNQTQETWYVTCKGNKWIGDLGNCTKGKAERFHTNNSLKSGSVFPQGIVMAIVIGILLGVVIGTILLTIVFSCRRYNKLHNIFKPTTSSAFNQKGEKSKQDAKKKKVPTATLR